MPDRGALQIAVTGNCSLGADILGDAYRRGAWPALIAARGDFVLAFDEAAGATLVSSLYSVSPYFYATGPNGLAHGRHVADVAARAGLRPLLDMEALATLICAGHTIGEQSLIAGVRRMPARAVVRFQGGKLSKEHFDWHDFHQRRAATPELALDAFNAATARVAGDDPVVSISAGLDSRVILSSLLHARRKPALLSMGAEQSDDVQAARSFSERLGLPLTRRPLQAGDYLAEAAAIARLTDGQKTADHWHSRFYVRGFQVNPGRRLLIGANGEFARGYYLDGRYLGPLAAAGETAAEFTKRSFWKQKLARRSWMRRYREILPAELRRHLGRDGIDALAGKCAALSPGGLREGLDRFYLDQRVRHFIGYGLRLAGAEASCATPFLEREWVECAWNLPRAWKRNSNWHRFALARNALELLGFPESGFAGKMASHLTAWQAIRRGASAAKTPYVDYRAMFGAPATLEALSGLRPELAPVFGEALVARLIADAEAGNPDPGAIGLILALGNWWRGLEQ